MGALGAMAMLVLPQVEAEAAPQWSSVPKPFVCGQGGKIVPDNSCLKHTGFRPNAGKGHVTPWWGQYRNRTGNCTAYVAYRLIQNKASNFLVPGEGNAVNWKRHATNSGKRVDDKPAVGAVAWYGANSDRPGIGSAGHVAYVEKVSANGGKIHLSESHHPEPRIGFRGGSSRLVVRKGSAYWPDKFLHIKDKPSPPPLSKYVGHIVQWKGDKKQQKTAWLVGSDLKRRWIPDIATYQCLKARGVPGPVQLPAQKLRKLRDLRGVPATCQPPSSPPAPTSSPPPSDPDPDPDPAAEPKSSPEPKSKPKPTPKPSVKLSKGDSAQGLPGCASVYCRFLVVKFENFSGGGHSIKCRASHGSEGGYYTYTRSGKSNTSSYCYYGFPGHTVWVTVDGVKSNKVVW